MKIGAKGKWTIAGVVLGGIAGFLYQHFMGCSSGQCGITASPMASTIYGAIVAGLAFSIIASDPDKNKNTNNDTAI